MRPIKKINLARKVASLPRDYNAQESISVYDLLKQTGYFNSFESIEESDLAEIFSDRIDFVSDWFAYSSDKRCGKGWYIISEGNQNIVGHLGTGEKWAFPDSVEAAAFFAKRELEAIRES